MPRKLTPPVNPARDLLHLHVALMSHCASLRETTTLLSRGQTLRAVKVLGVGVGRLERLLLKQAVARGYKPKAATRRRK